MDTNNNMNEITRLDSPLSSSKASPVSSPVSMMSPNSSNHSTPPQSAAGFSDPDCGLPSSLSPTTTPTSTSSSQPQVQSQPPTINHHPHHPHHVVPMDVTSSSISAQTAITLNGSSSSSTSSSSTSGLPSSNGSSGLMSGSILGCSPHPLLHPGHTLHSHLHQNNTNNAFYGSAFGPSSTSYGANNPLLNAHRNAAVAAHHLSSSPAHHAYATQMNLFNNYLAHAGRSWMGVTADDTKNGAGGETGRGNGGSLGGNSSGNISPTTYRNLSSSYQHHLKSTFLSLCNNPSAAIAAAAAINLNASVINSVSSPPMITHDNPERGEHFEITVDDQENRRPSSSSPGLRTGRRRRVSERDSTVMPSEGGNGNDTLGSGANGYTNVNHANNIIVNLGCNTNHTRYNNESTTTTTTINLSRGSTSPTYYYNQHNPNLSHNQQHHLPHNQQNNTLARPWSCPRSPNQPLKCPLCFISLEGGEIVSHFEEEVKQLENLRSQISEWEAKENLKDLQEIKKEMNDIPADQFKRSRLCTDNMNKPVQCTRWQTYERVRQNRQTRISGILRTKRYDEKLRMEDNCASSSSSSSILSLSSSSTSSTPTTTSTICKPVNRGIWTIVDNHVQSSGS